jgi:hypothetical protein
VYSIELDISLNVIFRKSISTRFCIVIMINLLFNFI